MKIQRMSTLWTEDSIDYFQSLYPPKHKVRPARVGFIFTRAPVIAKEYFRRNNAEIVSKTFPMTARTPDKKVFIATPPLNTDHKEWEHLTKVYIDTTTILPPEFTRYIANYAARANEVYFI